MDTGNELAAFDLLKTYFHGPNPDDVALSPDLQRVAVHLGSHVETWRVIKTPGPTWEKGDLSRKTEWSAELEQILLLPPPVPDIPRPQYSIAFSPNGRKLAAGHSSAIVWEVGTWRELWRAPAAESYRLSLGTGFFFAADGRRILSGRYAWDLPDLE